MSISTKNLLNIVYDLIAQNPIKGVYHDDKNRVITHDDLTNNLHEVDNENMRITFQSDDETVILQLTKTYVSKPSTSSSEQEIRYIDDGTGYTEIEADAEAERLEKQNWLDREKMNGEWNEEIDDICRKFATDCDELTTLFDSKVVS